MYIGKSQGSVATFGVWWYFQ